MDAYYQFAKLAEKGELPVEVFHFSWRNAKEEKGDYGLNPGPVLKTFQTLIKTTFMFQDAPDFILECRPYKMTQAQLDFLHDNDLDTLKFLAGLMPIGKPLYELDLNGFKSPETALRALDDLLKTS